MRTVVGKDQKKAELIKQSILTRFFVMRMLRVFGMAADLIY